MASESVQTQLPPAEVSEVPLFHTAFEEGVIGNRIGPSTIQGPMLPFVGVTFPLKKKALVGLSEQVTVKVQSRYQCQVGSVEFKGCDPLGNDFIRRFHWSAVSQLLPCGVMIKSEKPEASLDICTASRQSGKD